MGQCNPWLTVVNILITGVTATIEYQTAFTEEEGIKKIGNRIEKNKTIESIMVCTLQGNSNCKCEQGSYTQNIFDKIQGITKLLEIFRHESTCFTLKT